MLKRILGRFWHFYRKKVVYIYEIRLNYVKIAVFSYTVRSAAAVSAPNPWYLSVFI
jgi:hypothetical protein